MKKIPKHGSCFVCGSEDSPSMGVTWYAQDDDSIFAEVTLTSAQQGPPGMAHGGASAALLDEAMGAAVWLAGHRVASVNLNINYRKPVPLGQRFTVTARVKNANGKKVIAIGEILLAGGTLAVSGEGIFVQAPQLFQGLEAEAGITSSSEPRESHGVEK
ncbi:MAG TPA: PaaI family thioesterase [Anaerolineales bacterium]|nr:PaaI family thioesterase [Anaerolineales bacterium]